MKKLGDPGSYYDGLEEAFRLFQERRDERTSSFAFWAGVREGEYRLYAALLTQLKALWEMPDSPDKERALELLKKRIMGALPPKGLPHYGSNRSSEEDDHEGGEDEGPGP